MYCAIISEVSLRFYFYQECIFECTFNKKPSLTKPSYPYIPRAEKERKCSIIT